MKIQLFASSEECEEHLQKVGRTKFIPNSGPLGPCGPTIELEGKTYMWDGVRYVAQELAASLTGGTN